MLPRIARDYGERVAVIVEACFNFRIGPYQGFPELVRAVRHADEPLVARPPSQTPSIR